MYVCKGRSCGSRGVVGKGGAGTTSVAAMLALGAVARAESVVVIDLCGDIPAVLGIDDAADSPGLSDWSALATPDPEALRRIELPAGPGLAVLPRGAGELVGDPAALLDAVSATGRRVVVDCGCLDVPGAFTSSMAALSGNKLVVLRRCFLTLRSVQQHAVQPSGVVLLNESGRFYTRTDVEAAAGAPVLATIALDTSVANRIDAGLLRAPLPRALLRAMSRVAADAA